MRYNKIYNQLYKFLSKFFKDENPAGYKIFNKNIKIISGGYIGKKGDIVVDNYLKPSQVLGVSDGSGKFEKKISKKTKLKIKLIKKKLDLDY